MAVWASKIYLRWYKAFNTGTGDLLDSGKRPWEQFGGKEYRFVEIPISPRVSTIVGANETGKSQLLGAIEKVVNGSTELGEPYSPRDICRYCGLLTIEEELWPELGIEFSFETQTELENCLQHLGFSEQVGGVPGQSVRVFINGGSAKYATVFSSSGDELLSLTKENWGRKKSVLPQVKFIQSDLGFENQIHISQLIEQYKGKGSKAYEPLALQLLATELVKFDVGAVVAEAEDDEAKTHPKLDALIELQRNVKDTAFESERCGLERILFEEILKVPETLLVKMRELKSGHPGYVEQLVEEMNHRLSESLDISEYWQQDEDFSVRIEYKGGFFYFFITDRTGAKYTFDERSGGLKYFLSYYVQAKAVRDSMGSAGAIIVMDEPDGFLSAAGQRNLLSVFELLAQPENRGATKRRCQVIYTTHSPFLINRNFPDRISLVRKGDGGEGTQLVELVSTRQYEPVRTGLGIESAESLFMGSANIILEEVSAQRLFVSAIQRFGDPARIDDMLDLNRVTFVSASGVWDIPRMLQSTKRSKEKQPVIVVFVDGDDAGIKVQDEITGEKLVQKELVKTISNAGLSTSEWCKVPKTLEDLVPPRIMGHAIIQFVRNRWNEQHLDLEDVVKKWKEEKESGSGEKLAELVKETGGGLAKLVDSTELKSGVYYTLSKMISDRHQLLEGEEESLKQLKKVVREICDCLRMMLKKARTQSRQDQLQKVIRLEVESYKKIHGTEASKADVRRCLARLEILPVGADDKSRQTRENIFKLQQILEDEVAHAGFLVDADRWSKRLQSLHDCPWSTDSIE